MKTVLGMTIPDPPKKLLTTADYNKACKQRDELREALEAMLNLFDRGLDKNTVGRKTCDKAKQALKNSAL